MNDGDKISVLNSIKKQFLCNVPLKKLVWKQILSDFNNQHELISNTVNLDLVLEKPIKLSYQKAFVKEIITYLEKRGSIIDDSLYESYGRLVAVPSNSNNNVCYKHYLIQNNNNNSKNSTVIISLKENVNLICEGTTGLCTWQASLALSEWILQNKQSFNNKLVLELGSGIGLTGLTLSLCCTPSKVYFTDCHPLVLSALCDNIKSNIDFDSVSNNTLSTFGNNNSKYLLSNCVIKNTNRSVQVVKLPWAEITAELCQQIGNIDRIIAADIVYDKELFASLISGINCLFKYSSVENFILSCTERNRDTLDTFLSLLDDQDYVRREIPILCQDNFCWTTDTPIRIFNFSRL